MKRALSTVAATKGKQPIPPQILMKRLKSYGESPRGWRSVLVTFLRWCPEDYNFDTMHFVAAADTCSNHLSDRPETAFDVLRLLHAQIREGRLKGDQRADENLYKDSVVVSAVRGLGRMQPARWRRALDLCSLRFAPGLSTALIEDRDLPDFRYHEEAFLECMRALTMARPRPKLRELQRLFQGLRDRVGEQVECYEMYRAMLRACSRANDLENAISAYEAMRKANIFPKQALIVELMQLAMACQDTLTARVLRSEAGKFGFFTPRVEALPEESIANHGLKPLADLRVEDIRDCEQPLDEAVFEVDTVAMLQRFHQILTEEHPTSEASVTSSRILDHHEDPLQRRDGFVLVERRSSSNAVGTPTATAVDGEAPPIDSKLEGAESRMGNSTLEDAASRMTSVLDRLENVLRRLESHIDSLDKNALEKDIPDVVRSAEQSLVAESSQRRGHLEENSSSQSRTAKERTYMLQVAKFLPEDNSRRNLAAAVFAEGGATHDAEGRMPQFVNQLQSSNIAFKFLSRFPATPGNARTLLRSCGILSGSARSNEEEQSDLTQNPFLWDLQRPSDRLKKLLARVCKYPNRWEYPYVLLHVVYQDHRERGRAGNGAPESILTNEHFTIVADYLVQVTVDQPYEAAEVLRWASATDCTVMTIRQYRHCLAGLARHPDAAVSGVVADLLGSIRMLEDRAKSSEDARERRWLQYTDMSRRCCLVNAAAAMSMSGYLSAARRLTREAMEMSTETGLATTDVEQLYFVLGCAKSGRWGTAKALFDLRKHHSDSTPLPKVDLDDEAGTALTALEVYDLVHQLVKNTNKYENVDHMKKTVLWETAPFVVDTVWSFDQKAAVACVDNFIGLDELHVGSTLYRDLNMQDMALYRRTMSEITNKVSKGKKAWELDVSRMPPGCAQAVLIWWMGSILSPVVDSIYSGARGDIYVYTRKEEASESNAVSHRIWNFLRDHGAPCEVQVGQNEADGYPTNGIIILPSSRRAWEWIQQKPWASP